MGEKGKTKFIVVFATAWGPKLGGINAFNLDFCKALAKTVDPEYRVCCVVPNAEKDEIKEAGDRYALSLLSLGEPLTSFAAHPVKVKIETKMAGEVLWWVGHDIHTGPMANYGARYFGGNSAVFHHMAYRLYNTAKNQDGDQTADQDNKQREVIESCTLVFGIGPLLCGHAKSYKEPGKVIEIIPGLQQIEPGRRSKDILNVIEFGRLGAEDDVIKQGRLGAKAFGRAAKDLIKVSGPTPILSVIGLPENEREYKKDLKILEGLVKEEAGKRLAVNALRYSKDRDKIFKTLSEQDVCLMPSWHEGFGLAGWEAIAAEVPLVVTKNAGLFRLLDEQHHAMTANIFPVDIKDTDEDIDLVKEQILWIERNRDKAQKRAKDLRSYLLNAGYTWENTASTFAKACDVPVKKEKALIKIQGEKSAVKTKPPAPIALPDTYFSWLETHCSYAEIDRLQVGGKAIRVDLPEIFVPLYAQGFDTGKGKRKQKKGKPSFPKLERELFQTLEGRDENRNIEELIRKNRMLLIDGHAGSGKTTLLKHYAFEGGKDFKRGAQELPLLVFLKDLNGILQKLARDTIQSLTAEGILNLYFSKKEKVIEKETLDALLESGEPAVLLDGLDELSADYRPVIVKAFSDLRIHRPKIKLVISSRPHGLEGAGINLFGKHLVKVLPFNPKQVDTFITKWFQFIYPRSGGLAQKDAKSMIGEIREHPSIAELIENPLMLTAICILYHDGKELPQQRADLYDRFINNLLYRRFDEPEKVRSFLCRLAFEMQEQGTRNADKDLAIGALKTVYLKSRGEKDRDYGKRMEALFSDIEPKCGVLKVENNDYLFWHLTFQEFLTAVYLKDNRTDYVKAITDYWDNEGYREVIQLFIGYVSLNSKQWAADIVRNGLRASGQTSSARLLLAAKSLADIHQDRRDTTVLSETRQRLIEIINTLPEPKTAAEAGETLGWLGDLRDLEAFIPVAGGTYALSSGKKIIKPFELAKFPVTNQWFEKFLAAKGYEKEVFWSPEGWKWLRNEKEKKPVYWHDRRWRCPNAPVVGVSWYEAEAFCRWLTLDRKDGRTYRLPDEWEWEAAAAGDQKRTYPWGKEWDKNRCNSREMGLIKTTSVGIFLTGETPEKISDLAGNVWEWTSSFYDADKKDLVLRAGSWSNNSSNCRCAARYFNHPNFRISNIGFRCARS